MHLADAFIQSDLQYIQVIIFFVSMYLHLTLFLMVKLNCINQKACLINWNHETYNTKQQFI